MLISRARLRRETLKLKRLKNAAFSHVEDSQRIFIVGISKGFHLVFCTWIVKTEHLSLYLFVSKAFVSSCLFYVDECILKATTTNKYSKLQVVGTLYNLAFSNNTHINTLLWLVLVSNQWTQAFVNKSQVLQVDRKVSYLADKYHLYRQTLIDGMIIWLYQKT